MKFIGLGLILLGSLSFNSAWASAQKALKLSPKVLKCTRSIVERGLGKTDGLLFVAQLLESEIEGEKMLSHCKNFLLTAEADIHIDRNQYSKFIGTLSLKEATKNLLKNFNKPFYECRFNKIEAAIAKGFGIAEGLGAAKCSGTNKRTYIILLDQRSYSLNFISKVFSQNIYVTKENKLLALDEGAKAFAIGEYLGEVLETELELDEIGTKALSKGESKGLVGAAGRFKAIAIEQV